MQGVTRGTLAGDDLTMPGPEEWGEAGAKTPDLGKPYKTLKKLGKHWNMLEGIRN